MSEASGWDALSRLEQRALIKLFGGGSLSREPPMVVERLRSQTLVDEHDALSMRGLFLLTLAIRRQQGVVSQQSMITKEARAGEKGKKMSETQNWKVRYLQKDDPRVERSRLLSSMYDALIAACALRQRHTVQYVGGPNGEKFDSDAIVRWGAENVR